MSRKRAVLLAREEKLAYVEQVLLKKMTPVEVAKKTGVHEATVYEWLRKYREDPGDFMPGSGNVKSSEQEVKDLEKRVKELEQELAFLKKATAYFIKNPV
jgi:transposase